MQPIIKIIVVGLGVRGTHWVNVISNHKLAIISGFVDIKQPSKENLLIYKSLKIPFFTSFPKALEELECNAVLIATPPEYHYDQVMLAFKNCKHVICEKPLTESLKESIKLYKASLKFKLK